MTARVSSRLGKGSRRAPWLRREHQGDQVRQPLRSQSKALDDAVLKSFSRRPSHREGELAEDIVGAFFVKSLADERERTGRPLQGGELQRVDLHLYKLMLGLAVGLDEVYPTIDYLVTKTGAKTATIYVSKDRLHAAGLVDWLHRCAPVENPEPGEPTLRQTSNLYRVNELPPPVLAAGTQRQRHAYAQACALTRKQAATRVRARNALASDLEAKLKAAPPSDLYRRLIADGCAPARAAREAGCQDSS